MREHYGRSAAAAAIMIGRKKGKKKTTLKIWSDPCSHVKNKIKTLTHRHHFSFVAHLANAHVRHESPLAVSTKAAGLASTLIPMGRATFSCPEAPVLHLNTDKKHTAHSFFSDTYKQQSQKTTKSGEKNVCLR